MKKINFILSFFLLFLCKHLDAHDFLIGGIYKHNKETFEISKYNFLSNDIKIRFFISSDEDFDSKITIQNGTTASMKSLKILISKKVLILFQEEIIGLS